MVAENGNLIAESQRFSYEPQVITADIDLERLSQERMRQNSFGQSVIREQHRLRDFRTIPCSLELPRKERLLLKRLYERFPYVPAEPAHREERCREVYHIQVQRLVKRLQATGIRRVVIGVSGGWIQRMPCWSAHKRWMCLSSHAATFSPIRCLVLEPAPARSTKPIA